MSKCLLNGDALLRVKSECLCKEVDCLWAGVGEEGLEWPPFTEGQSTDVITRSTGRDRVKLVKGRRAKYVQDQR